MARSGLEVCAWVDLNKNKGCESFFLYEHHPVLSRTRQMRCRREITTTVFNKTRGQLDDVCNMYTYIIIIYTNDHPSVHIYVHNEWKIAPTTQWMFFLFFYGFKKQFIGFVKRDNCDFFLLSFQIGGRRRLYMLYNVFNTHIMHILYVSTYFNIWFRCFSSYLVHVLFSTVPSWEYLTRSNKRHMCCICICSHLS